MKIIPIRDLKNTVEIEKYCSEEQGPVFITKNGYGRLVVMNIEYYERTMREIEEAKLLLDGIKDVQNNNTLDGKNTINELRGKYGI
ncbi:type II toxin-antitoxin system Phd/YefM family antitoxin [Leptotrichia sp. oral taxon 223]|uniref:type II toxin-antitoxin system Phd/YefM family antitoxin n=1 Tax=Leptotrichia sp. oral taxon 223 TaxID=712363 RepID=UPI0015B96C36|nr:type II toxin-antitoxin system Phd/YefM family antitoxin [Leptotrichia sp. oral taxon 223]NWO18007.1 type II toxin-antitoxin system Phd/YefM family antitoxin [Leptotrichia sp. oral taxon 223]